MSQNWLLVHSLFFPQRYCLLKLFAYDRQIRMITIDDIDDDSNDCWPLKSKLTQERV